MVVYLVCLICWLVFEKLLTISEPEFRLPIMVTYLLFTSTGFFAWGQSSAAQDPWPVPVIVCLGLINFGVQLGTTGVVTYVVDCHREKAGEAFAAMNFVKNMFAFGLSFYINDWISNQGVRNCFFTIGGITMGVTLFTIPMWVSLVLLSTGNFANLP